MFPNGNIGKKRVKKEGIDDICPGPPSMGLHSSKREQNKLLFFLERPKYFTGAPPLYLIIMTWCKNFTKRAFRSRKFLLDFLSKNFDKSEANFTEFELSTSSRFQNITVQS